MLERSTNKEIHLRNSLIRKVHREVPGDGDAPRLPGGDILCICIYIYIYIYIVYIVYICVYIYIYIEREI